MQRRRGVGSAKDVLSTVGRLSAGEFRLALFEKGADALAVVLAVEAPRDQSQTIFALRWSGSLSASRIAALAAASVSGAFAAILSA